MTNKPVDLAGLSPAEKRALLARLLEQKEEASELYPLSFGQERLWFIERLDPGNAAYNCSRILHVTGHLDLPSLRRALTAVIARHGVLRTTFVSTADGPRQRIAASVEIPMPMIDLSLLPERARSREANRTARWETRRPFSLEQGPLLRFLLLRLDHQEQIVIFTIHHIISDAWSMAIFSRELTRLYHAYENGEPCHLPPLPIQYKDYALWQRDASNRPRFDAQLAYWQRQLMGAPLLRLPLDHARSQNPSHVGAVRDFTLSKAASEWCEEFSCSRQVTPFITLLSLFLVQLRYYGGQDDIVVGTDVANRTHLELEELIGYFANQAVIRTRFDGSCRFGELVANVREVVFGVFANQDLPIARLVEALRPDRNPAMTPLFQVMFLYQDSPPPLSLTGIKLTSLGFDNNTAAYDLTMQIAGTPDGLAGSVRYNSNLFEAGTIDRMIEHYQLMIEEVRDVDPSVEELSAVLRESDQERMARARRFKRRSLAKASVE